MRSARGRPAQASVSQTGQAGATPAGHSADPRRSATDGSLTRRRTTWPGRQPEDHPLREGGMLGVRLPPGPLNDALADQPGVVVTLSRWKAWVQIASRVLTSRVAGAPASPSSCNPPAFPVHVQ